MDTIIGLGSAGCAIADRFAAYPQYKILKLDAGLKGENCYSLPKRSDHESYDRGNFRGLGKFLKQASGQVLFVLAGSGKVSGATLQILKNIKDHNISILYIQPDVDLLNERAVLRERVVSGVLQQYARSGVFERMYMVSNLVVEDVIGEVPLSSYYEAINQTVVSTFHMINVFNKTKPEIDFSAQPSNPARISTLGVVDFEKNEEKLFFPLDTIADKCYYYAINKDSIEKDGSLFRDIRSQIKDRRSEDCAVSYMVHSTSYEENYVYCLAHSKIVQKNYEKVLDTP